MTSKGYLREEGRDERLRGGGGGGSIKGVMGMRELEEEGGQREGRGETVKQEGRRGEEN